MYFKSSRSFLLLAIIQLESWVAIFVKSLGRIRLENLNNFSFYIILQKELAKLIPDLTIESSGVVVVIVVVIVVTVLLAVDGCFVLYVYTPTFTIS